MTEPLICEQIRATNWRECNVKIQLDTGERYTPCPQVNIVKNMSYIWLKNVMLRVIFGRLAVEKYNKKGSILELYLEVT